MRVFITGGCGLVGRHLAHMLLKLGHEVMVYDHVSSHRAKTYIELAGARVIQGSILDGTKLHTAMRDMRPEIVYHLAAMLGVGNTERNRLMCYNVNVRGTAEVAGACMQHEVQRLIFASSSEVYGASKDGFLSETSPLNGNNVYAMSKIAGENIVKAAGAKGVFWTIARLFNTYGPGQVAQFVVPRYINAALRDERLYVYRPGTQYRSYCHVQDTVIALNILSSNVKAANEIVNVGSNFGMTIMSLAELVVATTGRGKIELVPPMDRSNEREIEHRSPDLSKIRKWGFKPAITVENGILDVIEYGQCPEMWETA